MTSAGMKARLARRFTTSGLALGVMLAGAMGAWAEGSTEAAAGPDAATLKAQAEVYDQYSVNSVIDLAPIRVTQERILKSGETIRLTSLHPGVNAWYLLDVIPPEGTGPKRSYHLENADRGLWTFGLADNGALTISGDGMSDACNPWEGAPSALDAAAKSGLPYAPICDGRAYLRNRVSGNRTNREAVSDFLRENVVFGDKLVNLIKGTFFEDAFLENTDEVEDGDAGDAVAALGHARLDRQPVMRPYMNIEVDGAEDGMEAGAWYAVTDVEGVYASVVKPAYIAADILKERNGANWLDGVEQNADVYLAAFDLSQFDLAYELGTDHPGLGWSSRPQRSRNDWNLPGPDGFNRPDPLVRNGMLNPSLTSRAVGAFAGGFKRDHGAYRFGDYATFNKGHHYGFLVNGVTFSKLIPNLATLYVTLDGEIGMKTWTEEDRAMIPNLAYARQNGVPLVVADPETGAPVPGDRVSSWGGGNWSGSADAQLRTLRSGTCLKKSGGKTFLLYGYFSSVTPSAMARTFQAYGCDYAMLLDMNSPELTYMAVYKQNEDGDGLTPMHLNRYMAESDPWAHSARVPRFVGFADNRDFFYLIRKE